MEIFVGNLPFDVTEQDIREKFAECGEVSNVKMLFDKMSGRFRGIAFVSFEDESQAKGAVANLNGVDLGGRPMRIDFSRGIEHRFNGFGGGFAPRKKFFKNDNRNFSRPRFNREKNFDGNSRNGFRRDDDFQGGNAFRANEDSQNLDFQNEDDFNRENGDSFPSEGGFQRKPFFKKRQFKPFSGFKKFFSRDKSESDTNASFDSERQDSGNSFENDNRQFRQNGDGFKPKFGGYKGGFKGGFKRGTGFKGGFKGGFKSGFKRDGGFRNRDFSRGDSHENGNFGGRNSFRSKDDFGDE